MLERKMIGSYCYLENNKESCYSKWYEKRRRILWYCRESRISK